MKLAGAWVVTEDWLRSRLQDGQDVITTAHLKAAHEAVEFAEEPTLEEWADVFICLVGAALHRGWEVADVAEAVRAKVAINQARTWAVNGDGTWSHV